MKQNYDYAIIEVLKFEGGYSNDPRDPGGATNFGITIADYRRYINPKGMPIDVKNMSIEDAKKIYKERYWDAVGGDTLPNGVDYCVFDYGVNSGVSRALRVYNRFKGLDATHCINAICDERLAFLRALKTFPVFGKGWTSRVSQVRTGAVKLANKPSTNVAVVTGAVAVGTAVGASYHWWSPFITWLQHIFGH